MITWKLEGTERGLRLGQAARRMTSSERFTWAELLYGKLGSVKVYVIYFPSRFDLPVDNQVMDALNAFGKNTGPDTSVNSWDTTDPAFNEALALFEVSTMPAVILATGLKLNDIAPYGPDKANLYTVVITDNDVLSNRQRLAPAVNAAHQILISSSPKEITTYVRTQNAKALLESIFKISAALRDEILKLKPKFQLPGGISLQVG